MPKRELAPDGLHNAKVAGAELHEHEEYGERVRWTFDLDDQFQEDGTPMRVFKSCSFKLTPKSALMGIIRDILGRPLTKEEQVGFDLESLIGKPVRLVIKHKQSATGNTYSVVDTIIHVDEEESAGTSAPAES